MIRALLIFLLVSVAVWRPAHADPLEVGVAAVKKGDYDAAVHIFRPLADAGNAAAQNEIGKLYLNGWGVSQDYAQAMAWFRKSAAQGNAPATNNVGLLFEKGWGVPADAKEAVSWYEKSAEAGVPMAQYNLGNMYASGRGVAQDISSAARWFRKAAEQGLAQAQVDLGFLLASGKGATRDSLHRNRMTIRVYDLEDPRSADVRSEIPSLPPKSSRAVFLTFKP